ncbi:MAG TPA: hypothetical protein VL202_16860 [Pararhizobium sp.]|uniref:hypothetical protein n=1 Tax=Pararhizobium sp. TaxID=1977563 RepID=UPI002B750416|nr:hypothetical protein [Pararhizobium sp.]HTO32830.1 hypothetical protein [Pararhizobium sp.]
MSASISRYLKDFSTPKVDFSIVPPRYFPDLDDDVSTERVFAMKQQPHIPQQPPQPQVDLEAERREAFAQGRSEAESEQAALHARDIATLTGRHAAELEAMRMRCDTEIAAMIHDRFSEIGSQMVTMLSDQTARVLAPVMDQTLQQKSIADLAHMINHLINAGEGCKIHVKGPLSLFEALKRHLKDETLIFRHQESTDIDLSVEFGESILVTRMAAWADTVGKVLA